MQSTRNIWKIDTHHHTLPPAYLAYSRKLGITHTAGAKLPEWSPQNSLDVMDANFIQTAILSVSSPGVYFENKSEAINLAKDCNDYCATISQKFSKRFGFFAVLPMPFTHESCQEAIRALDVLGADGIVLLGSTDGKFLGDPCFEELMTELNLRAARIFVHPNIHPSSTTLNLAAPNYILEFVCDTTRAAMNLILQGVMERFPKITWILSHAGGFLPYVAWRCSLTNLLPEFSKNTPQGVLTYIRRFYFDTALSPSAMTMSALQALNVESSHILFGSDFPFAPSPVTTLQIQELDASSILSEEIKTGIYRRHALSLFPKYAATNEVFPKQDFYSSEQIAAKTRRLMTRPIALLAEHLRNR